MSEPAAMESRGAPDAGEAAPSSVGRARGDPGDALRLSPKAAAVAFAVIPAAPLALLWAVLVVYGLFRFQETGRRDALVGAGVAAFLGTLTRYDGWFLLPFAALFVLFARPEPSSARLRHVVLFSVIAGSGPALWVLHNTLRFGNPIEFYNGPYSAQSIYAHQIATTGFRDPIEGSWLLSAHYYVEDLKLVIGAWPLELAVLGLVAWAAEG